MRKSSRLDRLGCLLPMLLDVKDSDIVCSFLKVFCIILPQVPQIVNITRLCRTKKRELTIKKRYTGLGISLFFRICRRNEMSLTTLLLGMLSKNEFCHEISADFSLHTKKSCLRADFVYYIAQIKRSAFVYSYNNILKIVISR